MADLQKFFFARTFRIEARHPDDEVLVLQPDGDGLGLLEVTEVDKDNKRLARISFCKERLKLFIEAATEYMEKMED